MAAAVAAPAASAVAMRQVPGGSRSGAPATCQGSSESRPGSLPRPSTARRMPPSAAGTDGDLVALGAETHRREPAAGGRVLVFEPRVEASLAHQPERHRGRVVFVEHGADSL